MNRLKHTISPVYNSESKVLILGSFPSKKSRESNFYYGNPQNRFWKLISCIFDDRTPITESEKREFLLSHKIALWDVISECDIEGSSDNSIKNVFVNDIPSLLNKSNINAVILNGRTAASLFFKHFGKSLKIQAYIMPSTSPANASFSFQILIGSWSIITSLT